MNHIRFLIKVTKHFLFCGAIFLFSTSLLYAQEFNCTVNLNTEQLEGNSYDYLEELKPKLEDYINEYKWTEIEFEEKERINCQVQIVINTGNSDFSFSGEAVFQVQRPIYNTTAKTTTVLLTDNAWQFSYPQGKSLIHDELQFDALTGFIDFFTYMMLGYDFDTFSELGGDPYFTKAQNILSLAQTTNAIGWTRTTNNGRNRNTLVTDLMSSNYHPLRKAYYTYHRLGLDQFVDKPNQARQEIVKTLRSIQETKRRTTSNFLFDVFFDAKAREIAAIFDEAETEIRLEAYNVLQDTDQGHLSEYESLQN